MGRIQGKVAVITGAASGMGRATALRFAKEGASVVLTDLNAQGGETAVAECAAAGGRAVFQRTDVTSEADIKAAVARAVKEYGRLDIMFNNAGVAGAVGPIEEVESADWDKTIAVLLRAAFLGMKYSIPEMRKAGGGSIISTASVAGLRGVGYLAPYSAAKAAIVNLTQAVAIEVGHDRIRVNCICPGGVNTPLIHRGRPGAEEQSEKIWRECNRYRAPASPTISRRWRCSWQATRRTGSAAPRWSSTEESTPATRAFGCRVCRTAASPARRSRCDSGATCFKSRSDT